MDILISVATCNRNNSLLELIDSFERMSCIPDIRFSVCIVDNSFDGFAVSVYQDILDRYSFTIKYVHCKTKGIPFARNCALKYAIDNKYDAIAFVDDDEVVSPCWLHEHCSHYKKFYPDVKAVYGPIFADFSDKIPSWLPQELYCRDKKLSTGSVLRFATTGNVFLDLAFVAENDLFFDERMALTGGSDTEFFFRFVRYGGIIHWCNEAGVTESVPVERMTLRWLAKRYFRYGSSDVLFWKLNHSIWNTLFWSSRRAVWRFIKHFLSLFVPGRKRSYYVGHIVQLARPFGVLYGLVGFSYNEYKARHCHD